jgi:hypothetical protein
MKFANTHKASALAVAIAIALAAPLAWGQGQGSGGSGGNKPPGGEEETAANNLSYPAIELNNAGPAATYNGLTALATPVLGKEFSYACYPADEIVGETTYPYTSCVNAEGTLYYSIADCQVLKTACIGKTFYRLYWQKTATNDWTADAIQFNTVAAQGGGYPATHVDWSDSLESQIWWDTAAIRVETTPYATLPPPSLAEPTALTRVTMWHVFGQGKTELWGAQATDDVGTTLTTEEWAYPILHTTAARLNIAKISGPTADCVNDTSPGAGTWMVNPNDTSKYYWSGSSLTLYDVPYTPELNIGGRYVYGFNWQLRRDQVPPSIGKTGWWRLTFYTAQPGSYPVVLFPALDATVKYPPGPPPTLVAKFNPAVAEDLSYIDICVRGSKGGGGIKGGGKPVK